MAQHRLKGTFVHFNFTDVAIFGAVVKNGQVKRHAVVSLPAGTLQGGWLQPEASLDLIFDSLLTKLKVPRASQAVLTLDGALVLARKLEIPPGIQESEIRGYLFMELGHSIVLPFEDPYFDYDFLENEGDKREIMLYAAPHEGLTQYVTLFKRKHLRLVAAEPQPLSVYQGIDHLYEIADTDNLLIWHVTATNHQLVIIENHVPRLIRSIDTVPASSYDVEINEDRVVYRHVGHASEIERAVEEMLIELTRVIDFYRYSLAQDAREIDRIILAGDFPYMESLVARYRENFTIALEEVGPVIDVSDQKIPVDYLPLVGTASSKRKRINLLPDEDVAPKLPILASLLLLLIGGAAAGYLFWQTDTWADQLDKNEQQIQIVRQIAAQSEGGSGQAITELQATIDSLEDAPRPAVPTLERITRYLPERGYVLQYSYSADHAVAMNVQFETLEELNAFHRQLLTDTSFTNVKLASIVTQEMAPDLDIASSTTTDPVTGEVLDVDTIMTDGDEEPRYIGQFALTVLPLEIIKGEERAGETQAPESDGTASPEAEGAAVPADETGESPELTEDDTLVDEPAVPATEETEEIEEGGESN
ncbi:type IV pilus biogenesis protein PilM [Exiguobacterium flavidum]|uniref:fimbrial assembly protein n=1 Tax=Exiguobacterium flavidum TaxID=2184695 RepID=UPI000DF7D21D|nr:fimbrial assembly protein [Exiguobacterium flavidum]